ncbi:MAG: C-GCAxxG-C-C family protein [Dehalococcoidia bacterium]|nr:C-GCAxxG-C-C family protein [Dehalococcoidia bacterium]
MSGTMNQETAIERVREIHKAGNSCAPSVLQVMQEFYGLNDDNLAKTALAFGGGIARRQSECGALVGGVMALGLKLGTGVTIERTTEDEAARKKLYQEANDLYDAFKRDFGEAFCLELTGHDFSKPGGYETYRADAIARACCARYVEYVVRRLTELSD